VFSLHLAGALVDAALQARPDSVKFHRMRATTSIANAEASPRATGVGAPQTVDVFRDGIDREIGD